MLCGPGVMETGLTLWCQRWKRLQRWALCMTWHCWRGSLARWVQPQRAAGKASAYRPPIEHPAELDDHSPFRFSTGFGISSGFHSGLQNPFSSRSGVYFSV